MGELVYQWVSHAVHKYGRAEVATWYWEVWNEPDISYWHGTPEEYDKLYDYAARGVKRARSRKQGCQRRLRDYWDLPMTKLRLFYANSSSTPRPPECRSTSLHIMRKAARR